MQVGVNGGGDLVAADGEGGMREDDGAPGLENGGEVPGSAGLQQSRSLGALSYANKLLLLWPGRRANRRDHRLFEGIEDLLRSLHGDVVILISLIAGYYRLANTHPLGQLSLRESVCDTKRNENTSYLGEPLNGSEVAPTDILVPLYFLLKLGVEG